MALPKYLIQKIRDVFGTVAFPSHRGLRGASHEDDWETDPERIRQYTLEEDINAEWWEIPYPELSGGVRGLSYLDTAGVEFYLPAYLTAALVSPSERRYIDVLALLSPGTSGGPDDAALEELFYERMAHVTGERKAICVEVLRHLDDSLTGQHESMYREQVRRLLRHPFYSG